VWVIAGQGQVVLGIKDEETHERLKIENLKIES
jgi:hypothetical protein